MIKNLNYNPEKLAEFKEMDRIQRYENGKRRMLVDMRIRQVDPSYRVSEDVMDQFQCTTCFKGHESCRCEGIVDISEGEQDV